MGKFERFIKLRTIASKLIIGLVLASLLPLLITMGMSYRVMTGALKDDRLDEMSALAEAKARAIETYAQERLEFAHILSLDPSMGYAVDQYSAAIAAAGIGSQEYLALHEEHQDFMAHIQEAGYYDVFLIAANGEIVYTVAKESDLGTNLKTGPLKTTDLAAAFERVLATQEAEITDFHYYAPSDGPAAFATAPILRDGQLVGVLALQLSADSIYAYIEDYTGLGETGEVVVAAREDDETVIIAPLRHDPEAAFTRTIDMGSQAGRPMQQATQGMSGSGIMVDYRGEEVLAAWRYLPTFRWGIVVKMDTHEAFATVGTLEKWWLGLGIGSMLAIAGLVVFFTKAIATPVGELSRAAGEIAGGNLEIDVESRSRDEIGELAGSFNEMVGNLRSSRAENEAQNWLKTGQADLNERMRGDQDISTLAGNVITYLAEFFGAQIGAMYLSDDNKQLTQVASYAYSRRKNLSNQFIPGEGLVGQAALENKPILITDCPDDYISVYSGLGEAVPNSILVFPLSVDNTVRGIIELGTLGEFSEAHLTLLDQVAESVAIAISSVMSRMRMAELLEETQRQSAELQTQQEELQTINEELEEQAQRLKQSEEELQTQQEELKTSNEELQEQAGRLKKSEGELQAQQEELRSTNEELEEKNDLLERQTRDVERARQDIQEKAEQLALSSRYKSEFLANMSHELRTPLNSLLILAKLLGDNEDGNLTDRQVEYAQTVYASGVDLLALINDILDMAKIESGTTDVDVSDISFESLRSDVERNFTQIAADKGLDFTIALGETLPGTIRTDGKRLRQVLTNLLGNAFKFTEAGGVTLKIEPVTSGWAADHNALNQADSVIAFSVTDTGVGVSADKQKIIFEAFQQSEGSTSRMYGGTGLGLSISREIARMLSGEIHLVSEPGKGSTFTLYLPNVHKTVEARPVESAAPGVAPVQEAPPSPQWADHRIPSALLSEVTDDQGAIEPNDRIVLIIEDDVAFATILRDMARDKGFKALVATRGEVGLALARQFKPDAATLDIKLPDRDGWVILDLLKNDPGTRHIPIHLISAGDELERGLELGAVLCLQKPVSPQALKDVFADIKDFVERPTKNLLVVEDDEAQRNSIVALVGNGDVKSTPVATGAEALAALEAQHFDCMVLDLMLPDMSGAELIERIKEDPAYERLRIVIYTGKELTEQEVTKLKQSAGAIIVKGAKSPERLLDETALFLHRVEADLPETKQQMIRQVHDSDPTLTERKVLVVDDDIRNIFAITSVLESHHVKVLYAENGQEGLDTLQANPDIDVVLMDIMMPEMDGYETIRAIRKIDQFRQLPIIALTAKAMKGDRDKCIEAGASDYIAKPIDIEQLLSLLRVWMYKKGNMVRVGG